MSAVSAVVQLLAWIDLTSGCHQVKEVLDGSWAPPMRVKILAKRGHDYFVSSECLSMAVEWHRLNPEDYIEEA